MDPDDPAAGTVSNADLTAPGDRPTWILLDTAQVVKPVIFQKRRDYTFTRLDKDGDENVFMRGEYIYGVEARVNAGYRFANSTSTDQIGLADVGSDCYMVDDQTVAKTSGSNTRSVAGKVRDVDSTGVWVEF